MLWYKAWRETRTRFLLSAGTIAGLCVVFVLFRGDRTTIFDTPMTFAEYISRITYKGYLRVIFDLLVLFLGLGGLLQEREYGTTTLTLALPVSRVRVMLVRFATGLLEISILSLLPALILPTISLLVGESYPRSTALQFSLLWSVGGAFIFAIAFLASAVFDSQSVSVIVGFLALVAYSIAVDLPGVERFLPDINDMMSGTGMSSIQAAQSMWTVPWTKIGMTVLLFLGSVTIACQITRRKDF